MLAPSAPEESSLDDGRTEPIVCALMQPHITLWTLARIVTRQYSSSHAMT